MPEQQHLTMTVLDRVISLMVRWLVIASADIERGRIDCNGALGYFVLYVSINNIYQTFIMYLWRLVVVYF